MEIDIGWLMIIIGLLLLIVEASQPGFFVAVPGTILIVLGTVTLLIPALDTKKIVGKADEVKWMFKSELQRLKISGT